MGALEKLGADRQLVAHVVEGIRHDTGTPLGYLKAVVDRAASHPDWGEEFTAWLSSRHRD
jgi:UTP--glucose-1-phosphate uridylyltransferase